MEPARDLPLIFTGEDFEDVNFEGDVVPHFGGLTVGMRSRLLNGDCMEAVFGTLALNSGVRC